jgi:hypothetical protein
MNEIAAALDQPAQYWQIWNWVSISIPNLITVTIMVLLFLAALFLPFPKDGGDA